MMHDDTCAVKTKTTECEHGDVNTIDGLVAEFNAQSTARSTLNLIAHHCTIFHRKFSQVCMTF